MVPSIVQLGGQEDFLTWDARLFDAEADFVLVAIRQGRVNVSVARLKGSLDRFCHLVWLALPCTQANGWYLGASVELEGFPCQVSIEPLKIERVQIWTRDEIKAFH